MNNNSTRLFVVCGAIVLAAIVFQVFFRYEYIPRTTRIGDTSRTDILRIDRLSQSTCVVPCDAPKSNLVNEPTVAPTTPPCSTARIVQVARSYKLPHGVSLRDATGPGAVPNVPKGLVWDQISDAVELDDGHVYEVSSDDFNSGLGVQIWQAGSTATVCSIRSRIDRKVYYTIESGSAKVAATLVI